MKRLIMVAALLLAGCTLPDAGMIRGSIKTCMDASNKPYVCEALIVDGKEQDSVTFYAESGDHKVYFDAKGVKAFEGQRLAAAVSEALIETTGHAAPETVAAIVRAILGTQALDSLGKVAEGKAALDAAKIKVDGIRAMQGR